MTYSAQNSTFSYEKKINDADTKSLIFQGYDVAGCPILRYVVLHQTILTIVY